MAELGFTGYAIDQEDREALAAASVNAELLLLGDLPARVDPRNSPLAEKGWLRVEDQGQIGSCQGNALTECLEYCYPIASGGSDVVQLSRMFAYIASQQESGINGDSGSTLDGGTRAAKKGICTEQLAPYPRQYPGRGYVTEAMQQERQKYRLESLIRIQSAEHGKQFLGSGAGIIQIGVPWGDIEVDGLGCIRSWSFGRGGHSVVICGYVPDSDIGARSSAGWWGLLKNSWRIAWGLKGYAYVDPRVIDQLLGNSRTVMYGRSDMVTPKVRPLPVDWTRESLLG